MDTFKSFFFLFSLIVSFSLIEGENYVEQVCQQTQNKANCVAAFAKSPNSKNATLEQLGIIALKLAAKSATDTSLFIKKSQKGTSSEPELQQKLSDCLEQYIDANEQIDNSVASLLSKDDKDIQTWLNAAISGIVSCNNGIPSNSVKGSSLKKRNADFRDLCNTALVIGVKAGSLKWQSSNTKPKLLVGRDKVETVIRTVMDCDEMRGRAKELGIKARKAVENGGSSFVDAENLIQELRSLRKN